MSAAVTHPDPDQPALGALRELRLIHYCAVHISDLTGHLATLTKLKKGAIGEVCIALGDIKRSLSVLESDSCQRELQQHRQTEVRR